MVQSALQGPYAADSAEYKSAFGAGQNTPSPQGAASQGALGTPPEGGGNSAFSGAKGEGGTGKTYWDMHKEASTKDLIHAANKLDESLGQMGSGVIAKTKETIQQAMANGDESTLAVAQQFGWAPTDKMKEAGGPVRSDEAALANMDTSRKKFVEKKAADKKWNREQMAGFLTEMGLRILASNREDVGGAFGEAAMGMKKDKDAKKRQDAADKMAAEEAERKGRRDEQQIDIAGKKEERDQAIFEADKKAGRLGEGEVENNYTIQRDDWMKWKLPDDPTKAQSKKAYEDFIDFFKNATRVTPKQREDMIDKYIKRRNDAPRSSKGSKEWKLLGENEKRAEAIAFMDMVKENSSFHDDSGPSLDYNADATFN